MRKEKECLWAGRVSAHRRVRDRSESESLPGLRAASRQAAFTLIEILLASVAAAMILVVVYGIFTGVLHTRDNATARIRESRLRARAAAILRRDLQGALVSGGILATMLEGDSNKQSSTSGGGGSGVPGYLKMTTTTGKDTADELYGDVQEVEYYVTHDTENSANPRQGGTLVRVVTRDLLSATTISTPREEQILNGVESLQVAFYDGTTWQTSWQANPTTYGTSTSPTASPASTSTATSSATTGSTSAGATTQLLPLAIRVDIRQSASSLKANAPLPLEILVPWTTQPFVAPTPTPTPSI